MNIHSGTLLISTPALDKTNFEKVIVFIAEHNQQGAMGFVINNLFARTLNELLEFNYSKPFPLFDGGPVEREGLFFLHQRPDIIEGGTAIINSICMGGNFKQTVSYINDPTMQQMEIKLYEWYTEQQDKNISMTSKDIKQKAKELCTIDGFKASKGWLEKYQAKFNLELIRAQRTKKDK